MSLPPGLANWHWRSKGVSSWAKQWFQTELTTVVFSEGDATAAITQVTDVEGDVELGMRKSKLLTIYDCKIDMKWAGTASDGTAVEGKLSIPEVSHEITVDGDGKYVYDFTLTTSPSNASVIALYDLVRKQFPLLLEAKFSQFPIDLLETHGKDLKVEGSPAPSGSTTPAVPAKSAVSAPSTTGPVTKSTSTLNLSTITVSTNFMASADDLFELLTDDGKITSWTRAPAKSKPVVDSEYSLFGGNIFGKYTQLDKPSKIVQTWTLKSPNWPDHAGTMTITLEQGSDSTQVTWELKGVPKGHEEEIENNLRNYYVRGFQSIGLGSAL
ncbi:hypothetical protein FRC03_005264 [Tulasnella sp. 419]|nr:hypothetical protein FRC02_008179 [Tulasnella sp. 418]KAG8961543.1 hypothetical protein FRC03_005264 [Tulasnella sp. 419]